MLITAQDMTPLDFHHFFLMFGCSLRLLVNLLFDLGGNLKQGNYQNYVETWQTDMRQAYDVASRSIQQLLARGNIMILCQEGFCCSPISWLLCTCWKPFRKGITWKALFTLGRGNTCNSGTHIYRPSLSSKAQT